MGATPSAGGGRRSALPKAGWAGNDVLRTSTGVTMRRESDSNGYVLRFSGKGRFSGADGNADAGHQREAGTRVGGLPAAAPLLLQSAAVAQVSRRAGQHPELPDHRVSGGFRSAAIGHCYPDTSAFAPDRNWLSAPDLSPFPGVASPRSSSDRSPLPARASHFRDWRLSAS